MSEDANEILMRQLVHSVLELQGLSSAHNTILHSLLSIVCEKSPSLIDEIKDKIKDVADLKIQFEIASDISKSSFKNEIDQCLKHFELIIQAASLSHTYIEVKDKK